jgi:hypothetical protein
MLEFEGATATAPTAPTSTLSEIGAQVIPLFVVFQRPPLRVAA